jgi:tRNA pseudouridine-54 N-methylase
VKARLDVISFSLSLSLFVSVSVSVSVSVCLTLIGYRYGVVKARLDVLRQLKPAAHQPTTPLPFQEVEKERKKERKKEREREGGRERKRGKVNVSMWVRERWNREKETVNVSEEITAKDESAGLCVCLCLCLRV